MIHFKLDETKFQSEIKKITESLGSIPQAQNTNTIARAVGSIAAKEFIKNLNMQAKATPLQFHHLYEWGEVGKDSSRLIKAKRNVSNGNATIELIFKPSKKKVPIAQALKTPGKTGKSVTRSSVFRNKAEFMESGKPSQPWTAKRNIVFLNGNQMIFRKKGTVFTIASPGGKATTNSLERYVKKWENGMAQGAIEKSKIFNKLEKNIAKTLSGSNPSSSNIRSTIKSVCDTYNISGEI